MLAAVAFLVASTNVDLVPTDDIWVYPQASDQKDTYLRVWGSGDAELAPSSTDMDQYSYAYLKFDVSKVPSGKVTGAKLVLTHIASPSFTLDQATKSPLVARPVSADFTEKTWDFGQTDKTKPDGMLKSIFGKGAPEAIPADKEFSITIDLLKGPNDFGAYLRSAKTIGLSLSSSMDVAGGDKRTFYKFYSKDAETATKRPVLKLTIE